METLRWISVLSLILSAISAAIVAIDILRGHPQEMAVMNWVCPITALWSGPLGLAAYYWFGRAKHGQKPYWQVTAVGDLHCAAGCTLGDFAGEWIVFLGAFTIAGSTLWPAYIMDFALAYTVGIVFQYFAIAPMRNISGWPGIWAAIKADTISLTAFEVGMFAWMYYTHEILFQPPLEASSPIYWFLMQIAMAVGFLTAYPANWLLIKFGLKEAM